MQKRKRLSDEDEALVVALLEEADKLRLQLRSLSYMEIAKKFDISVDVIKRLAKQRGE